MQGALKDWQFYLMLVFIGGMPFVHFLVGPAKARLSRVILAFLSFILMSWMLLLSFLQSVPLRDALLGFTSYSIVLFIGLSEFLMRGGGAWLTRCRGDKWTKEIDYLYLLLAAFGLVISIGQMNIVAQKLSIPGTVGPLAIATALVLRAIKTRAEIAGWNKLAEG